MPDLKDTYVVHCSSATCTMGMRPSYVVLRQSHGVFMRGQALMTVKDCQPEVNIICFGGCFSMENPSTIEAAEEVKRQIEEEAPDTFIDKVMNLFGGGKSKQAKQNDPSAAFEGMPQVVGKCEPKIVGGQEWDNGKEDVETDSAHSLLGEAKIFCMYGGEIKLENAGQPEAGG